jgi:hypothetical protein
MMIFLKPDETIRGELGKREMEKGEVSRPKRFPQNFLDPIIRGRFRISLGREVAKLQIYKNVAHYLLKDLAITLDKPQTQRIILSHYPIQGCSKTIEVQGCPKGERLRCDVD